MKSPPLPRLKKPPSPQKLKLLCSFNGAFTSTATSTAPRYTGGEARIVSLVHPITLSRLLSKLSDLRPKLPFTVLYQRPDSTSLVPIATDDDVRCMIEDHDRGKAARLRLYLVHVQEPRLYSTKISGFKDSVVESRTQTPKMGSSQFSVSNQSAATSELLVNQSVAQSRIKTQHAYVGDMSNGSRGLGEKGSSPVCFNNQPDWGFIHSKVLGGNVGIGHARVRNQRCGGIGPYHVRDTRMGNGDFGVPRGEKVCVVKGARSSVSKIGQGRTHCNNLVKPIYVGGNKGLVRDHVVQGCDKRSLANHHRRHPHSVSCYPSYLHPDARKKPTSSLATTSVDDGFQSKHIMAGHGTGYHAPWEDMHPIMETKNGWHHAESNVNHSHNLSKELYLAKPVDRGGREAHFSTQNTLSGTPRKNTEESDVNTFRGHHISAQLYNSTLCDEKPSLVVALHNISLWDSPELHQASPCAPLSISNAVEPKGYVHNVSGMPSTHEPMLQLKDMIDDGPSNSRPGNTDMREELDIVDFSLLQELSRTPRSLVEQASLEAEKDLVFPGKNQEILGASSITRNKENVEALISVCAKDAKEVGNNLLQCYPNLPIPSQELQTIKNSDIEEIRVLGTGAYGTVFYGKWKGSDVAIKRLKPSCFSGDEIGKDRLVADFWKEARLLGQLHHPNVVAFYGVVTDGSVSNLATVTEYMVNGSLKQVLQKKDRTIDRRKRLIIAMHAAFGMEYLHEKNVVHFDLKSHNLLVNMKDPLRPICKIGDLGLSKVKQRTLVSGGVRGTIPWMAPELFNCTKTNMVTEKVDVFSFGIVMWELLTGEEPYANKSSEEIVAGIIEGQLRPDIPSWCDPAWRSLMERCWSSDPSSRPSFAEIAKELRAIGASINIK